MDELTALTVEIASEGRAKTTNEDTSESNPKRSKINIKQRTSSGREKRPLNVHLKREKTRERLLRNWESIGQT